MAPSLVAGVWASAPPSVPIAVRVALTITAVAIGRSSPRGSSSRTVAQRRVDAPSPTAQLRRLDAPAVGRAEGAREDAMKFSWFHLMPYRWLPPDFRDRYRSIWVDIPNRLYDPVRGHQLYNEYLDMLEYADQMGFDAVGVNEHHQNGYGMMPSPNLMAAALARRCQNANLLVLGNSIALYNPPVRVAEEFAMLDVISGGRLIAGFPVGTSMDINYCYGQNPATVREKYREAHDLIIKAWAEREPFAWNGKYTKLR